MASRSDQERLRQLKTLAELVAQQSAAELNAKRLQQERLAARLVALDTAPPVGDAQGVTYKASGAATLWQAWQIKERRRLGILAARARLAAEAARRSHARADARRQVLDKLCNPR